MVDRHYMLVNCRLQLPHIDDSLADGPGNGHGLLTCPSSCTTSQVTVSRLKASSKVPVSCDLLYSGQVVWGPIFDGLPSIWMSGASNLLSRLEGGFEGEMDLVGLEPTTF